MNRQIFRLFALILALFGALILNLTYIQIVEANKLATDPRNSRFLLENYAKQRGEIRTADGVVLARSAATDDQLRWIREYPEGELFAHVTGYLSFQHGEAGLERSYAEYLLGTDPSIALRPQNWSDYLSKGPQPGNVELSISARGQQAAAAALGGRKGAVAAIDPRTGAVLALYANPTYDPNPIASHDDDVSNPAYDAAISPANGKPAVSAAFAETEPPGSTFKVVTAAAALMNGIGPDTAYPDPATLDLPNTSATLSNFSRGRPCAGGQTITLAQALPVSCNTTFGQIGLALGHDTLRAEAEKFGFDRGFEQLGLDAAPSVFPPPSAFKDNVPAQAMAAIGQFDVAATPLQMAVVAGAVGNGGLALEPRVVSRALDYKGAVADEFEPTERGRPLDATRAGELRDMMVEAVERGTGRSARISGVSVAGKTGTTSNYEQAWFIAFAPAEAPTVAIAVLVQNEGDEATGGQVAAPAARQIMQELLRIQGSL